MLLSVQDDIPNGSGSAVDIDGVPTGSTVMETLSTQDGSAPLTDGKTAANDKAKAAKMAGNTSSAAKEILEKYMRRPRRSS